MEEERVAKAEAKAAKAKAKALRPWFKKKRFWALGAVGLLIAVGAFSNQNATESIDLSSEPSSSQQQNAEDGNVVSSDQSAVSETKETPGQKNARESAESYLRYSAFSRVGLIKQLEFEKYSTADATYAVDSLSVNWNEQAANSAKSYLDYSSFSRQGLIDQLIFDGFTQEQATYGVDTTGL